MIETTILLVRHGETDWNRERRVQGHSDRPLNSTGMAQAEALVEELADEPIDAVYSSDLARAFDTAQGVASARALHVQPLPELREKNFGTWEGLTDTEIRARFPQASTGPWGDAETSRNWPSACSPRCDGSPPTIRADTSWSSHTGAQSARFSGIVRSRTGRF